MNTSGESFRFSWFDWFCLWYPPGWLILFNRHWQHYRPDPDGWNGLEYGLFLLPGGFYLASLLRWLRLKSRALWKQPSHELPIDPDPDYQDAFRQEILTPILKYYFRAELHQVEHLPTTAPGIVALNHAGMCFPWDFLCLAVLLGDDRNWFVQPVAHPIFFDHPWLVWWLPRGWSQVLGAVKADRHSFEAALKHASQPDTTGPSRVLLYAPESWRGLAKGWQHRYRLTTFDPSFIRLSIRHQVPVLPVICMGSEYLHPWTFNSRLLARWFKMPLLPVSPLLLVFLLFPSMGVWAVRTRLRYYLQPVQYPWQGLAAESRHDSQASERSTSQLYQKAEALRSRMQQELDRLWKASEVK